jgi:hypothetical protein
MVIGQNNANLFQRHPGAGVKDLRLVERRPFSIACHQLQK